MKRPSLEEKTGTAATPSTSGISVTPSTLGILQTPEVPEILEAPFARLPPGRLISLGQQKTSTDTSDIPSSYEEEEAQPKQLPSKMSAPNAVSKHHLKKPTTSGKPNKQRELPATLPVSEPKQQVLNFAKAVPGSAPAIKDSPTRDFLTAAASRGGTASMSYKDLNCITDDDYWQAFINTVPDDHSPRQPFVIRFRYVGDDSLKGTRDYLLKHFITEKMEFPLDTITDIIQEPGSKEIDVCLESQPIYERFWAACKRVDCFHPDLLHGFEIVPLFRGDMKVMTVALRTTAIPAEDIAIWIKRHADLLMGPHKIKDSYGCWTGEYRSVISLRNDPETGCVRHLPKYFFIGADRVITTYSGQPPACYQCGGYDHFRKLCISALCVKCGEMGHNTPSCRKNIECNFCLRSGHTYTWCPEAYYNRTNVAACLKSCRESSWGNRTEKRAKVCIKKTNHIVPGDSKEVNGV
ncbi:uncharacterized protein LOC128346547 [Hemicordylus capensis]|uniref:uncharacterized protein LOC128346547 n=1 Tax=Hemicordylus capensis TaxID=884348 RepID=UPI0023044165|nr:uncharacterized protein LOC128346547 [Hemicordylus capensis]